jgi:hypothetical protein
VRVRFRYSKLGKVRWTSHRDMARMWERAFRRTHLPLAYSQGFSPRPKVSFGLALPTGGESLGAPSLQHEVTSCAWAVWVADVEHEELGDLASAAVAAEELFLARERKGHTTTEDVRPGLLACTVEGDSLRCELATQPRALRPSELLRALRPDLEAALIRRTHQWIERDGARAEPLALLLEATGAPHVHGRAS